MYHVDRDKEQCDLRGRPQVFVESEGRISPKIELNDASGKILLDLVDGEFNSM